MFKKLLFCFFIGLLLAGCTPVRKPLPPNTPDENRQRPRPIPSPRNLDTQVFIDDFISGMAMDMPGVTGASALVVGDVALVGVKFSDQISAERRQAIRRDISDKVLALDGIKDTLITSESEKIKKIDKIARQMRNGKSMRDSWKDLDGLMSSMTKNSEVKPKNSEAKP